MFELYNDNAAPSEFRFRLKAKGNYEVIGKSEGYTSKQSALNGINSIKVNCLDSDNFKIKPTSDSKYYWNLFAKNGEIVLSASETYVSIQGARVGINSVIANAPHAAVIDRTDSNKAA